MGTTGTSSREGWTNSSCKLTSKLCTLFKVSKSLVKEKHNLFQDWRKNVLGILSSPEVQLLNKAERLQLGEDVPYWECADCLAAAVIVDPSIIKESAAFHAQVSEDGSISRGAVFVDYKGREERTPNIVIIRNVDVEHYKMILLSSIGHAPTNVVCLNEK
jgi:hypothetical protein